MSGKRSKRDEVNALLRELEKEKEKVTSLEKGVRILMNVRPEFDISFDMTVYGGYSEDFTEEHAPFTVLMTILNKGGKASAIGRWNAKMHLDSDEFMMAALEVRHPVELGLLDGQARTLVPENQIYKKCLTPIQPGGVVSGYIVYKIDRKLLKYVGKGLEFTIEFEDVFGNKYNNTMKVDEKSGYLSHESFKD